MRRIAIALAVALAAAVLVSVFATGKTQLFVIAIEVIAVAIFAYYWWVKTQEYKITAAEKKALRGDLEYQEGVGLVDTGARAGQMGA